MNLSTYSLSDLNMYLRDTYGLYNNTPVRIQAIDADRDEGSTITDYRILVTSATTTIPITVPHTAPQLPIYPISLGYRQVNDYAVYLYRKQHRNYKKLTHLDVVRSFVPQHSEFQSINKRTPFNTNDLLLTTPEYPSLTEAFSQLANGVFSVALHMNYAIVKKGRFRHPVIYYKQEPVIEYDGTNLNPLIDQCHVTKFLLEVTV